MAEIKVAYTTVDGSLYKETIPTDDVLDITNRINQARLTNTFLLVRGTTGAYVLLDPHYIVTARKLQNWEA